MTSRGYARDFAERCSSRSKDLASTVSREPRGKLRAARLRSSWVKCHYPDVFCAAILNSQPMGFYQPAQLVRDARQHSVEVREADVNSSAWDCTLEPAGKASPHRFAVRLGFRQIQGLNEDELNRLIESRGNGYAASNGLQRWPAFHASRLNASPRRMPSARSGSTGERRFGQRGASIRPGCGKGKDRRTCNRAWRFRSLFRI